MFGVTELLIIALIALLFLGASRIPAIGAGMGKGIRNFIDSVKDNGDKTAIPDRKEAE